MHSCKERDRILIRLSLMLIDLKIVFLTFYYNPIKLLKAINVHATELGSKEWIIPKELLSVLLIYCNALHHEHDPQVNDDVYVACEYLYYSKPLVKCELSPHRWKILLRQEAKFQPNTLIISDLSYLIPKLWGQSRQLLLSKDMTM